MTIFFRKYRVLPGGGGGGGILASGIPDCDADPLVSFGARVLLVARLDAVSGLGGAGGGGGVLACVDRERGLVLSERDLALCCWL